MVRFRAYRFILLANLVSVGQVTHYHNDIVSALVVFPMAIAAERAGILANLNAKQAYREGQYLSFNLNLNLPPRYHRHFLPASSGAFRVRGLPGSPGR